MSWDTSSAAKGAARNGFQRRQHDIPDKPNQVSSAILSSQNDAPYAPPHKVHAPFSTDNTNHMDLNPDYDHRRQERRLKEDEETDQKSGLFSGLGMNKQPNGRRGQQSNAPIDISVTASSQNHSRFNGGGVPQHPTPPQQPHQQRSPSPSYGEQGGGGGGGGGGRSHLLKKKNQEVVGKITGERTWSHTDFKVQQDSGENEHLRRQMELYNARGGNGYPGHNSNFSPIGGGGGMQPQPPYGMNGGGGGGGRNSPGLQPIVNNSRGGSPYPSGSNPQSENGGGSPSHLGGGGGAGGQRSGSRSPYGGSDEGGGGGGGPPYSNLGPIPSSAPGRRSPQPPLSQSSDHASPLRNGGGGDTNNGQQQPNGDTYYTPRGDRSDARVRTPEPLPTGYVGTQRAQQALDREMQSHSNMYTSPSGGNDNGQHYQHQQYNGMGNQHTTIVRTLQPIEPPARMLVPCVGIAPYCPNDLVSQVQSNYNEAHTSYLPTVTYSTYTYTSTN